MHIYRCDLMLMEALFFSSREISNLYQTEPLIGNYALAYAFGFCRSAYFNDGKIHYRDDLGKLNREGLYVTPGTFTETPRFILRQFNAQTDAYWSAFGAGFIAARSEHGWSKRDGQHWHTVEPDGSGKRLRPTNRPQHGRIRMLAVGNQARCYVLSREAKTIPMYIRLGKFMSKARVESQELTYSSINQDERQMAMLLNPADLSRESELRIFDLVSVPPTPLVRNALIQGAFWKLSDGNWLPQGMTFNVGELA